jgi:hypothetical protein
MWSSKSATDAEKAVDLALKDDNSNAELNSKQPKEFENEIKWKQWLKQPVVERKTEVLHY